MSSLDGLVASRAATALLRGLASATVGRSWSSKARRHLLKSVRRLWVAVSDPPVSWIIFDSPVLMPLSHELPIYLAAFPLYGRNLGRIAASILATHQKLTIIDIGANVGDSVVSLGRTSHAAGIRVLCLEPQSTYFEYLRHNLSVLEVDATAFQSLVTNETGSVRGRMIMGGGTAALRIDPGEGELPCISMADALELSGYRSGAVLVKIDTDGMDLDIIKGSLLFLESERPSLFFECDASLVGSADQAIRSVLSELHNIGYQSILVYDNFGWLLGVYDLGEHFAIDNIAALAFSSTAKAGYLDLIVMHSAEPASQIVVQAEAGFYQDLYRQHRLS